MNSPRTLSVKQPVKLIFAGGFLGSGKTTALGALAKRIIAKGMRLGIITNDQSGNLADTLIVRQMLEELDVPVEEVVEGCFCCKFDELVDQMDKILVHKPDILMGEPVGSCTDFVAAVAHPIKIHYRDSFIFAPLSTMVDPDRMRELLHNVKQAVKLTGIEARVEKKWTLSPEIMERYGLLLSPAFILDGVVVAQGKVYKTDRIVILLQG